MHVTVLEILVCALGETLLVVWLVIMASATVSELGVLASTVALTMIAVAASRMQPVPPALVGKMAQLAHVSFLQLLMQLLLCFCANLFNLMVLKAAIILASLVN